MAFRLLHPIIAPGIRGYYTSFDNACVAFTNLAFRFLFGAAERSEDFSQTFFGLDFY